MQNNKEIWKPIKKYSGVYEVSNTGKVRRVLGCNDYHILAQGHNGERRTVSLWQNSREKRFRVHRLVLSAFVGPCPQGMETCHNDGNASNNHVSNLRWDTHISNCQDRKRHGRESHTFQKGQINRAKITIEDARVIRAIGRQKTLKEIAEMFPIGYTQISNILLGYCWSD